MEPIFCDWCGTLCNNGGPKTGATGYARTSDDKRICYECCAYVDRMQMEATGKAVMYLTGHPFSYVVTNWPGSLQIPVRHHRTSEGYGFGVRYPRVDVWFTFQGAEWHGVHQGNWNSMVRVKRLKKGSKS